MDDETYWELVTYHSDAKADRHPYKSTPAASRDEVLHALRSRSGLRQLPVAAFELSWNDGVLVPRLLDSEHGVQERPDLRALLHRAAQLASQQRRNPISFSREELE